MTHNEIAGFKDELTANLTENILPYWMEKMVDPRGGFYGRRDGNDRLDRNAPKGAILNARLLWTFSAAYRVLRRNEYLDMANRARDYILGHFIDREHGGMFWSVDANGAPLDTKKQFYAIGFGIYGLAEHYRATGDEISLRTAQELFHIIEAHSRDRIKGGYIEATTRDWQPIADMRLSDKDTNASKTMNTHLHIIEGYTALLRVWRDPELLEATRTLLDIFLDTIEDNTNHHLILFFDDDWRRTDRAQSFGHDIEASWLLLETAMVIGDAKLTKRTLAHTAHIADAALQGRCTDGSMVYERHDNGRYDNEKHWWVQAENVVGQIYLAAFHNRPEMLDSARLTWDYIRANLLAPEGEWLWSRLPDGSENRHDDKAGFWKCPYHNGRMCLEAAERLAAL